MIMEAQFFFISCFDIWVNLSFLLSFLNSLEGAIKNCKINLYRHVFQVLLQVIIFFKLYSREKVRLLVVFPELIENINGYILPKS